MTAQATRLMPAGINQKFNPTTGMVRKGVTNVALFEFRQAAEKRTQMTEIDRAVLLESVRQRRKAQQRKTSIESGIYSLRSNR